MDRPCSWVAVRPLTWVAVRAAVWVELRAEMFVDDKVVAREQITLSLTFDHRIVDGAPAARFLQTLRNGIEKAGTGLIDK